MNISDYNERKNNCKSMLEYLGNKLIEKEINSIAARVYYKEGKDIILKCIGTVASNTFEKRAKQIKENCYIWEVVFNDKIDSKKHIKTIYNILNDYKKLYELDIDIPISIIDLKFDRNKIEHINYVEDFGRLLKKELKDKQLPYSSLVFQYFENCFTSLDFRDSSTDEAYEPIKAAKVVAEQEINLGIVVNSQDIQENEYIKIIKKTINNFPLNLQVKCNLKFKDSWTIITI